MKPFLVIMWPSHTHYYYVPLFFQEMSIVRPHSHPHWWHFMLSLLMDITFKAPLEFSSSLSSTFVSRTKCYAIHPFPPKQSSFIPSPSYSLPPHTPLLICSKSTHKHKSASIYDAIYDISFSSPLPPEEHTPRPCSKRVKSLKDVKYLKQPLKANCNPKFIYPWGW